ncbi:MAG: P-type conjugative transfer protein TrbJ [Planctomycetota bacterium]|jgi:P-type conjugative transfer protein TrbJ|nr:P-type conjugative transfer protein TrbJ [Planctomycetota bacterium]
MKRIFLCLLFSIVVSCGKGHAMAVIDSSNLAQNIVAAQEAMRQTQNQILQLQNQLNQYQRMLRDAMNPGDWAWGDVQDTINQLKNTMGSIKNLSGMAGGFDQFLSQFGSYDNYIDGSGYGGGYSSASAGLMAGDYAGSRMQKDTADDLLRVIREQEEQLDQYQSQFEKLKNSAASAEGQQEAIQAGNQMLSLQVQLLSQIHALMMAQNNMLASVVQTENNRQARNRMGSALQFGESDVFKSERQGTGKSFGFTD